MSSTNSREPGDGTAVADGGATAPCSLDTRSNAATLERVRKRRVARRIAIIGA
jgi:hypothetical protein